MARTNEKLWAKAKAKANAGEAKAEAEAFIDTQFDFFSSGSLEKAKETLPWMLSL